MDRKKSRYFGQCSFRVRLKFCLVSFYRLSFHLVPKASWAITYFWLQLSYNYTYSYTRCFGCCLSLCVGFLPRNSWHTSCKWWQGYSTRRCIQDNRRPPGHILIGNLIFVVETSNRVSKKKLHKKKQYFEI
jgi:hypothetical protein